MYVYVCMIGKLRIDRVLMPAQPSPAVQEWPYITFCSTVGRRHGFSAIISLSRKYGGVRSPCDVRRNTCMRVIFFVSSFPRQFTMSSKHGALLQALLATQQARCSSAIAVAYCSHCLARQAVSRSFRGNCSRCLAACTASVGGSLAVSAMEIQLAHIATGLVAKVQCVRLSKESVEFAR